MLIIFVLHLPLFLPSSVYLSNRDIIAFTWKSLKWHRTNEKSITINLHQKNKCEEVLACERFQGEVAHKRWDMKGNDNSDDASITVIKLRFLFSSRLEKISSLKGNVSWFVDELDELKTLENNYFSVRCTFIK